MADKFILLTSAAKLQGHNEPCYYCGKSCNALAGNTSDWPIPLTHSDEPGKVKWHHIGCVSQKLEAARRLAEAWRHVAKGNQTERDRIAEGDAAAREIERTIT